MSRRETGLLQLSAAEAVLLVSRDETSRSISGSTPCLPTYAGLKCGQDERLQYLEEKLDLLLRGGL